VLETSIKVGELGHLVLYVRDVERSAAFYRDVLGFKQVWDEGMHGIPVAVFSSGRTHHELLLIEVGPSAAPVPAGRRVGLYHFGLKIGDSDDELRAAAVQLRADNVAFVGAVDHTVTHSLYVLDHDGNEIELYIDVPGASWDAASLMSTPKPLNL
jgi:catechol-2,3-dioxygenase